MPRKKKKGIRRKTARKKQLEDPRHIHEFRSSQKKGNNDSEDYVRQYFVKKLLEWYKSNKRSFFWRENPLRPYHYVLIEIMLQKTRAETVENFITEFLEKYGDPSDVLSMDIKKLEETIKPLGLYKQRSKKIKKLAGEINVLGESILATDGIYNLPGVGEYIGHMTRIMAYGHVLPIVDTNVVRIFKRFFGLETIKDARRDKGMLKLAKEILTLVDDENIRDYSLALLDFGALMCLPRKPSCEKKVECCLQAECKWFNDSLTKKSD